MMKVKDPHFVLEKIEKYIKEDIRPSRVLEAVDITEWKYYESSMEDSPADAFLEAYDDGGWADFRLWDTWGGYDRAAWFRTYVRVPERFLGARLAVRLLPGPRNGGASTAEALLYIDEKPVQGMDIWHEEALLEPPLCEKRELFLALKAWSGVLAPPKFRTFQEAQLLKLDMAVDRFCFTADTVRRCAQLLDDGDLRRIRLTKLLNDTFRRIDFLNYREEAYYASVHDALSFLESGLSELGRTEEIKPTVYGVGHSHIDMAWLWRLNATREKASRTFSTALNLMKQYPEYRYMHSSPQLYAFLKEDYPEIYAQVKRRISEGRWEITGGMWVEPDTNIPSGESLVRQFMYGKRFIREEFGKETALVWLPDVFGYSAALPQIMKKCGMKYFMTTKISWNQYNHFPYDTFLWKGLDGSEIFTHFITTPEDSSWFYTYNGHMDPEEVTGVWKNYRDKDKNDELLIAYGWGDGGGGPTREMLEQSRVMKNIPGIPRVKMSTAEEYFERIYEKTDHESLGKWDGELYFELHRGTYTSQAANKRYNRRTETLLHNLEFLSSLAGMTAGRPYPKEELDEMWKRTLLNQFHDILPGSSIRQVYEDTTADYEAIREKGERLCEDALHSLAETIHVGEESVAVFNTTGFERDDYICIPYGGPVKRGVRFCAKNGPLSCADTPDGVLIYVTGTPAYGYQTLRIEEAKEGGAAKSSGVITVNAAGDEIETPYYSLSLNGNGEISGLYDKENTRRVDCMRPMNVFAAFEDKPQRFDAWDVDVYYKEKPYERFVLTDRQVLRSSGAAVIRQTWRFHKSAMTQDMVLYEKSRRIDFVTRVDWKEKQVFLKAYFPVDVHAREAAYEIQFGSVTRPTHTNTEWDFARFEVSGHRWADLSEGNYGVAVLNDCKYGYDARENVLGLSLLKSAVHPDETADRRTHDFTYSLYPHAGDLSESDVQKAAVCLNTPLLSIPVKASPGGSAYDMSSLVWTDSDHVQIDTVKASEDGRVYVVRLYEYKNRKDDAVTLYFGRDAVRAEETDLCEEAAGETVVEDNRIRFAVGCFEIKTFQIFF